MRKSGIRWQKRRGALELGGREPPRPTHCDTRWEALLAAARKGGESTQMDSCKSGSSSSSAGKPSVSIASLRRSTMQPAMCPTHPSMGGVSPMCPTHPSVGGVSPMCPTHPSVGGVSPMPTRSHGWRIVVRSRSSSSSTNSSTCEYHRKDSWGRA